MTVKKMNASVAFKAILLGAAMTGGLMAASSAQARGPSAPALAQSLERAVVGAQSDARAQGLTSMKAQASVDSAVSRVIASSGADGSTVISALNLTRQSLSGKGQATPTISTALSKAAGTVNAGSPVKPAKPSTYVRPPKPPKSDAGGSGGSDYRADPGVQN